MRKIKFLSVLLIILFSYTVKASANIQIDCGSGAVNVNENLSCNINLNYQQINVERIEFIEDTSIRDVSFVNVNGFTVNASNHQVVIVPDNILEVIDDKTVTIAKMNLKMDKVGNYTISFNSIKIINSEGTLDLSPFTKNIEVKENNPLSNDNLLTSITIDEKELIDFAPDKLKYTNIVVHSNIISLDAKRSSDKSLVTGLGKQLVKAGNNPTTLRITVTAENKEVRVYELEVKYEKEKEPVILSDNNKLDTLELYNGKEKIDFDFDNKKTFFDIKISDKDIEKIKINATLQDNKASFVSKYGPREVSINYGNNKIEIKVKAENEGINTYTLNIIKEDKRSNDVSLKSLSINGNTVSLLKDKYDYELDVDYNTLKTEVEAVANDSNSKIEYEDIPLELGENSPLIIKVVAENNSYQEYKITITRSMEEEKYILENISILGYDFSFDINKKSYNLKIKNDEEKLNFVFEPESNIKTKVLNNDKLENGSVITIYVTDDDGEKMYTITIEKEKEEFLNYTICGGVFMFGLSLFVTSIFVARKRSKSFTN